MGGLTGGGLQVVMEGLNIQIHYATGIKVEAKLSFRSLGPVTYLDGEPPKSPKCGARIYCY